MKHDLLAALKLLAQLKKLLRPHFSKALCPVSYEDIDYITQAITDALASLATAEHLHF